MYCGENPEDVKILPIVRKQSGTSGGYHSDISLYTFLCSYIHPHIAVITAD